MAILSKKSPPEKLQYLIYLLALLKFILPFLLQNRIYEPHRDEFLYLAEARTLALRAGRSNTFTQAEMEKRDRITVKASREFLNGGIVVRDVIA